MLYKPSTEVLRALTDDASALYKPAADAFAPATYRNHMKNVRIKTSCRPASVINRTRLGDILFRFIIIKS